VEDIFSDSAQRADDLLGNHYARWRDIVNGRPVRTRWEGFVTLEISQHDAVTVEDLRDEGCAGALFRIDEDCEVAT